MTIRFKLTVGSIVVILVANTVLSLVSVLHLGRAWLGEVQNRVRLDLNSARAAYNNHMQGIGRFLEAVSMDATLGQAVKESDGEGLQAMLSRVRHTGEMDFLAVVGPDGHVISRSRSSGQTGEDLSENPIVAGAFRDRAPVTGTVILSAERLANAGGELAERARFELLPTPQARPTREQVRTDGMVVAAAVPIFDAEEQLVGLLYAGDLLNRRYEIVDSIKEEVFFGESYEGKDIGTVTIFQGDLRVATNVTKHDGSRAVGTRVSAEVAEEVLDRGGVWADNAFVVNDWYITAYEPIRDPTGEIIGILYVGLLRAPFIQRLIVLDGVFLAIIFAATLASLVLIFYVTHLVLQPIGGIISMSHHVIDGDLSARVGIRPPGEIGVLCEAIDRMADAVADREERLKTFTRQQIGRSEKLASIGRLAAGVAHEINNPLTGVLTFAHLLREKQNLDEQDRQDLDLVIHETKRVSQIVRGLLDFARERQVDRQPLDVNDVIRQTLRLLGNRKAFQQITVREDFREDLPAVDGDMNQLQQVLLNLSLNACEAMPDGGTLTIGTRSEDGLVLVTLADTGCGIKRSHLDQIFEPFFSTKPIGKGTGLGLSVSYGIIQQHGGDLQVESEEGLGATFTIFLPPAAQNGSNEPGGAGGGSGNGAGAADPG